MPTTRIPQSHTPLRMKNNLHTLNCVSSILAALAIICLSSCERADTPSSGEQQGSGRVISFTAAEDSVWPDMTKSSVNSVGDLLGNGFKVWGSWAKCPDDDTYWIGDYSSGVNGAVFGATGTTVTATDKNNDGVFNQSHDAWEYSPERDWYKGYYTFAAAIPASELTQYGVRGTHTSGVAFSESSLPVYTNKLTLNFPSNVFDLSSTQIDLMYAFATQDNSAENANQVSLTFEHICTRLNISIAAYDPAGEGRVFDVQSVTVYGLLNSIGAPLEFTGTTSNVSTRIAASNDRSTQDDPFHVADTGWEIASSSQTDPEGVVLIEDLLVFPGTLSTENPLKLRVDYLNVNGDTKSIFTKVTSGIWLAGKTYSYTFQIDLNSLE